MYAKMSPSNYSIFSDYLCPAVAGPVVPKDEVVRPEDAPDSGGANVVHHAGLEVDTDRPGNKPPTRRLAEVNTNVLQLVLGGPLQD